MALRALPNLGDAREYLSLAPGFEHPAILRCCQAWNEKYVADKVAGKLTSTCLLNANDAFRDAMPPLCGAQGVSDFIACLTHGMVSGVISDLQGEVLLKVVKIAARAVQIVATVQKTNEIVGKKPKNKK